MKNLSLAILALLCLSPTAFGQDLIGRVRQLETLMETQAKDVAIIKADQTTIKASLAKIEADVAAIKTSHGVGTTVASTPKTKTSSCSGNCTCGCVFGGDCTCGAAKSAVSDNGYTDGRDVYRDGKLFRWTNGAWTTLYEGRWFRWTGSGWTPIGDVPVQYAQPQAWQPARSQTYYQPSFSGYQTGFQSSYQSGACVGSS